MSNVRFDELELMLMAMFEQPTLRDTIQVLTEAQDVYKRQAGACYLSGHAKRSPGTFHWRKSKGGCAVYGAALR